MCPANRHDHFVGCAALGEFGDPLVTKIVRAQPRKAGPEWKLVYAYALLSVKTTATGCEMRGLHLADVDLNHRHDLPKYEWLPFSLYSATALPMVVAITDIAVRTHRLQPQVAASPTV